jgi:hypothetical protein
LTPIPFIQNHRRTKLLAGDVSSLMDLFSSKTSPEVHWHLAPMVKAEREYQMIDEALRLLPAARKVLYLFEQTLEITEDRARAQVRLSIKRQIEGHGIEEIEFEETLVDWPKMIDRAARRLPPFDKGETEKGFRDAVILETFLQLHKKLNLSHPNQLILVSRDRLLKDAAKEALGEPPEVRLVDTCSELKTILVTWSEEIEQVSVRRDAGHHKRSGHKTP